METAINKATASTLGPVYARFFSSGVLKELAHKGHSTIASRLVRENQLFNQFNPDTTVCDFYDAIFNYLIRHYRHEYIYKNAIAEKILLGKHNLNTAFMLMEFCVDDCIADAVVLNGTSHVYEIKSDMDSLERLDRQIAAYLKMFDFITIITTERFYNAVDSRAPKGVGIMVLADGKYQFRRKEYRRDALSNKSNVDPLVIFNSLQKREYLKIIKNRFNVSLANHPNTQIYSEAKQYFKQLSPEEAHDFMVVALKLRRDTLRVVDFVNGVPNSLKAASLSIRLTREERIRLVTLLYNRSIASAFS